MERASILIVEDEAVVALDLKQELEGMGYNVIAIAERGAEAVRLVQTQRPDLALMDIIIKGAMDGIETAEHLGRFHNIPVVFLTSLSDPETIRRAAWAAPYGYLTKPFEPKELYAVIEIALYKARMESQLRESEQRLKESEERFRNAFDAAPLGMALVDMDGRLIEVNAALCRLLGYSSERFLIRSMKSLNDFSEQGERERIFLNQLLNRQVPVVRFEKRYRHYDGKHELWTLVNVSLLQENEEPAYFLYQILDVTSQKETEQQLAQLAYSDQLTGLANRARFYDDLNRMISEARRGRHQLAVVFMDLDHFKHVNDSLGHQAGDLLLQEIARRLEQTLRETDCVARLGGDEFVLAIPKILEFGNTLTVMEKVRSVISQPIRLGEKDVVITPSMGISIFPDDGEDAHTLLRCADSALYAAKAEGRNRFSFFRPELAQQAHARLELEGALRKALDDGSFFLEYQPIIKLSDGALTGFEALIRWQRSERVMRPKNFIPIAEEAGLIIPMGAWVLYEACRVAAQWPESLVLHVNCSVVQFREDSFVDAVKRALEISGLSPKRLCLELTEVIMLKSDPAQMRRIEQLKAVGITLSIDDYGTGYSSLAFLKRYAPSNLKVDGVFIHDIDCDVNSQAIVSATIAMAHDLGIEIVAEGVETEAQADYLRHLKCDQMQGFLFSQPLSEDGVVDLIRSGRYLVK